jgi:hypothetical protein
MDIRHVAWDSTSWGQNYYKYYYDPSVISWISDAVMQKTMGLDKRPIKVTERIIKNVLDSFLDNHRAYPGDIFTRYNIPNDGNFSGDFGRNQNNGTSQQITNNVGLSSNYIINQVVEFISEYLKNEYGVNTNNKRYSAWNVLYGANNLGLRAHSQIKLQEKRPTPFQFNMKF